MNSKFVLNRPSCLVSCSIASTGCMPDSVRRSMVTACSTSGGNSSSSRRVPDCVTSIAGTPARWAIYGYAVLLGVGYSATASLIPAMVSDRFSGPRFGAIVGVGLMGSAAGSAIGPWMAGVLFDLTGSYMLAFAIAAGSGVAAGAAGWWARVLRVRAA